MVSPAPDKQAVNKGVGLALELEHLGSRLLFLRINYHPNCEAAVNSQTSLALYASYLYVHDDMALKRSARNSHTSSCWRGRCGRSRPSPGGWRTSVGPIACSIKTRGCGGCRCRESLSVRLSPGEASYQPR